MNTLINAHPSASTLRRLCMALLLALSVWAILITPESDFVQDYAAAKGWMLGLDPNGPTDDLLAACCSDAPPNQIPQTAHPPLATLLALPFALLPWTAARWAWMLVSWLLITLTWEWLQLPPLACLLSIPFWVIGISLGALEPLLLLLVATTLQDLERAPLRAGAALGLAMALKVYPGMLVLGLLLGRRWRPLLAAGTAALLATAGAEIILGPGVTRDWLAFSQVNATLHVGSVRNVSLVRIAHTLLPALSANMTGVLLALLLTIPLVPLLRCEPIRAMLPVMLLSSPICWELYFVFLSLVPLGRAERALLALSGLVGLAVWMRLISGVGMALPGYGPLFVAAMLAWYRWARAGLAAARPAAGSPDAGNTLQ
ncbi:DUF2029 domain-containing protein [Chloroflexales bacterium ZM16-3]|nr:DUF2029 domain-containing protein [Chloroflexales bacterium ZM16-3]